MLDKFRYYMSSQLIEWSINILPDDYTKSRMRMGINIAADIMMKELEEHFTDVDIDEDEYLVQIQQETLH